jgi:phenylalanyl-tRNA synthetase beta chain
MKILLSWLREYCPIEKSPEEIASDLTRAGIEVDHIEELKPAFQGVIAVRIDGAKKLESGNTLVTIFDGTKQVELVSGAPNCREAVITAYAPAGARMPDGTLVEENQVQGHASPGFLCSEKELALTDFDKELIELEDTVEPGCDLNTYFRDTCFDVTITPNLGHCLSVMGIARELSAFSGIELLQKPWQDITPRFDCAQDETKLSVQIQDTQGCPRYCGLLVDDVSVVSTPSWMRIRLERSGIRSINNIVDITNYVNLALGQPMHAFDAEHVADHAIIVRKSQASEKLVFLDDVTRTLPDDTVVIADKNNILACAGVMGGAASSVTENTRAIIFESAYFTPRSIARASRKLSLQTESSRRFERGCDQNITLHALDYAYKLLHGMQQEAKAIAVCDQGQKKDEKTLSCRLSRASKILGYEVSVDEVESSFSKLNMPVSFDGKDSFTLHVPAFRHDLNEEIDLIEEIGKLVGFEQTVEKRPYYTPSTMAHHPLYHATNEIRRRLVAEGLQEVLTCDLLSPELAELVCDDPVKKESIVTMLNPLSEAQSVLRPSLLSGMLESLARNTSHRTLDFHAFEVGHVHLKKDDAFLEPLCVAIMLSGTANQPHFSTKDREVDFFDLKGILENFFSSLGFCDFSLQKSELVIFHPGRQAKVYVSGRHVGMIGEIHPKILRVFDIKQRVFFSECDIQELLLLERKEKKMTPLAQYPGSDRDWTITLSKSVSFEAFMKKIDEVAPDILESRTLTSIFEHEKLGKDYHNVTIHFVYRDREKTVSQQEVETAHNALIEKVTANFS